MNILINVDNNYIERAKDLLLSISFNNNGPMNIYMIYDSIDEEKLADFSYYVTEVLKYKLNFVKCDAKDIDFPIYIDYISKATYYRLFFPFSIDEKIDRVLYLDCDIICTGNIEDFYATDFENNLLIGCENMVTVDMPDLNIKCNERLDLPSDNHYINAGVLLINVEKYKNEVDSSDLINFINDNSGILEYQDQDVINKYFYGKIKLVDNKYNYQINAVNYGMENHTCPIVHYSGEYKPWNDNFMQVNKLKSYYDFLYFKGDKETLEKLIKVHSDNYRDFLLRSYCDTEVW